LLRKQRVWCLPHCIAGKMLNRPRKGLGFRVRTGDCHLETSEGFRDEGGSNGVDDGVHAGAGCRVWGAPDLRRDLCLYGDVDAVDACVYRRWAVCGQKVGKMW
jgi:hypothetical protein